MQVFLTVFAGVLVFVISQIFLKLVIEPVHQLKRVISDISFALIQYGDTWRLDNIHPQEDNELLKVTDEFRKLASQLIASCDLIPVYHYTRRIFFLPKEKKIATAKKRLIDLSNLIYKSPISEIDSTIKRREEYEQEIRNVLNIKLY